MYKQQSEIKHIKRLHLVPRSCCQIDFDSFLPEEHLPIRDRCVESYDPELIYVFGCYDTVLEWLSQCASILLVLGFCVISFIKLCFLCILRYEIKEMIQKIKVLKGMEDTSNLPVHDLEAYLPRPSVQQDSTSQTLLTTQTTQSNYKSGCTTDKIAHCHHVHHHHLFGHAVSRGSTNGNNNETACLSNRDITLAKKHSIV